MSDPMLFDLEDVNGEGSLRSATGLLRLLSCRGIGPRRAVALATAYATWQNLAASSPTALRRVAGSAAASLAGTPEPRRPDPPPAGTRIVGVFDDDFPGFLRSLADCPAVLWVRGTVSPAPALAIVGTRKPTAFGLRVTRQAATEAAKRGAVVVSGLALGIDTAAHAACLETGGTTVAVLGSGIDSPSLASNRDLADQIVASGGALISEVPPGTRPSAGTLVARNRLQSGLCRVVLVTQCGVPSGTLRIAGFAIEQGRVLAAVAPSGQPEDEAACRGSAALVDPGGCPPALLGATGRQRDHQPRGGVGLQAGRDIEQPVAPAVPKSQGLQSELGRHKGRRDGARGQARRVRSLTWRPT